MLDFFKIINYVMRRHGRARFVYLTCVSLDYTPTVQIHLADKVCI